ncbi:MAG: hypothetical protein CMO34_03675 [Verrucomicrobia bacterium]|nr:hypothetical protein [Verrucomicrobiota bacterium]
MGGTNDDLGSSIAVDGLGNVYTTGRFKGTADFDPGAGTQNLISFGASDDVFISKLDAAGNFVWAKSMGSSSYDEGNSIALDNNGYVYTTGAFNDTVDFDPGTGTYNLSSTGSSDIFISTLDTAGNFVSALKIGGRSHDVGSAIAVDSAQNIYTTGYFNLLVDFDPGAGTSNLIPLGWHDVFISKYGPLNVGIMENPIEHPFHLYPNPTKGRLHIDLGTPYTEVMVNIRNALGQEVLTEYYRSTNMVQVHLAGKAGIYFIEVNADDKRANFKVLKE